VQASALVGIALVVHSAYNGVPSVHCHSATLAMLVLFPKRGTLYVATNDTVMMRLYRNRGPLSAPTAAPRLYTDNFRSNTFIPTQETLHML